MHVFLVSWREQPHEMGQGCRGRAAAEPCLEFSVAEPDVMSADHICHPSTNEEILFKPHKREAAVPDASRLGETRGDAQRPKSEAHPPAAHLLFEERHPHRLPARITREGCAPGAAGP